MKIVIDLQCCQTEARGRGMGRYSLSLTEAMTRVGREHDFLFLLNRHYLASSSDLARQIERFGALADVVLFDYPSVEVEARERVLREQIASVLRNDRVETLGADIYHISSLFEGESVFGPAAAYMTLPKPPLVRSATIHDVIPALYPKHYLGHAVVAPWYYRTMSLARQLDMALSNSETTRQDAARLLRIDPRKIVNILGAAGEEFHELKGQDARRGPVWRRLDGTRPYLLYVGGPDFRKNVDGMIEAFALASEELGRRYQLAIVYGATAEEEVKLRRRISQLGIAEQVTMTGQVSDRELVELYSHCALFVFPSLYEGLGLPVVEAMRCGAPVLVGDNSSLRELVDEPRYRFDASSPRLIADAVIRALTGEGELERMRAYARARSGLFSWENSARAALDAWGEMLDRRRDTASIVVPPARPRIAMFTPLPPAKSGIADYSADFLAELRRYAEIEVFVENAAGADLDFDGIDIWHHSQFPLRAQDFDAIVYQLGNSPFHHYMAPYVEAYPGVVVLHDAYVGHLSHHPREPGPFVRQVIRDHGGEARRILSGAETLKEGALALIEALTCAATHVYRSRGVIVHSRFARDLLVSSSRLTVAPPIAVIPQYRAKIAAERRVGKAAARERLGLPADGLLVGSFGHVSATKGVLELIDAFTRSAAAGSGRATLVFVGELEGVRARKNDFRDAVLRAVEGRSDILITGFVGAGDYDLYLQAMDIAVQLRTLTRGETSRALLDVMWAGLPLIYNRLGASSELPEEAAAAIGSCEPGIIAAALDRLADVRLRESYGRAGLAYMEETRDADVIAPAFIRAVLDMTARSRSCGPAAVIGDLSRLLVPVRPTRELVADISASYVAQERSEEGPRLLIDVSHIREQDLQTGVQRVVRELTRRAYQGPDIGLRPQAFAFGEAGLIHADDFAQSCGARLPIERPDAASGPLKPGPFDKMLLADGSWHLAALMEEPVKVLNARAGQVYGFVHDILPIQHPRFFPDHVAVSLRGWLDLVAGQGEGLICTSRTGADALIGVLKSGLVAPRPGLRIGHVRLGADFATARDRDAPLLPETRQLLGRPNLFLMVGTVEPRKGHAGVLDAFEQLWANREDVTLAIVGKDGWGMEDLLARLARHPEHGKRLARLGFVPEADLAALYAAARATIVASLAEGFGLPIYEAAHFGSPLVLSDLPVFRELAGDHARYFEPGSAPSIAEAVRTTVRSDPVPSGGLVAPSWSDCARGVFDFMAGRNDYYVFGVSER